MLILDLWSISFHAVRVFCLGKNLLSKHVLGRCGIKMVLLDWFYSSCINVYLGVNDHAWYVVATIDIQAYLIANRAVGRSKNLGGK